MSQFTLQLEQCSGPLDLLLSLIDEEKLSISELSISTVTEQYLAHIDAMEEVQAEELADFLVIASRLLLLKAKQLLPQFAPEEEEAEGDLIEQLRLYKRFQEASKQLNAFWERDNKSDFRLEPVRPSEGFVWPTNVSAKNMHKSMLALVQRLKPLKALPQTTIDRAVSMKRKVDHIRSVLAKAKQTSFQSVIEQQANKTDVIVSFLALLELVKTRTVTLSQDETFSDIMISKI